MRRTTDILNDSPCYRCKERYEACHGKCDKYKAFTDELAESSNADKQEKDMHNILGSARMRSERFQAGKKAIYMAKKRARDES